MGILYVATTGNAANSGSSDNDAADLTGAAATVAGSVVTLDGGPDLSAVTTSGASQATILLSSASNSNQKIFWITAVDNGAKTVTVVGTPTVAGSSAWRIGGRHVLTQASIEGCVRAGDIVQFNDSPATTAGVTWTCRASGDNTSGFITLRGISSGRPVLTSTAAQALNSASLTGWKISNLNFAGITVVAPAAGWLMENCKVSNTNAAGINIVGAARVIDCEVTCTGASSDGISMTANGGLVMGCYVHDCGRDGIRATVAGIFATICKNIVEGNTAKGIYIQGAATAQSHNAFLLDNTIYGNGDSGIAVADADHVVTVVGNILSENGNAAGEYNVEWEAGSAELFGYHSHNCFYHSGGGGGANLSGLTANSTEITTDPGFTNAGALDFSISSSSGAKGTGFPAAIEGTTSTGYPDMGAVQRQETSSSGSGQRIIGG
jgi:parallel beta-helix repeat protein